MKLWGRDELALERRATRFADMQAAGTVSCWSDFILRMIVARKPVPLFGDHARGFRTVNERFTLRPIPGGRSSRKECPVDAIHLPNAITLPTAFGAPGTPLQAGQVVQALVLELIESDVFRLQLPQAIVDVRSDVPLDAGSTITLAVKGTGANTRLVIYADDAQPAVPARRPHAAPAAAPNLAGKHPIGEAVIIARAPAAQAPAGPAG